MRVLHAKASAEIVEEERRKKRRLAITEASASQISGVDEGQEKSAGPLGSDIG